MQVRAMHSSQYSNLGIWNLRNEWVKEHQNLSRSLQRLNSVVVATDISLITRGGLQWPVRNAHNTKLGVPLLVQVEDIINVAVSNPRASTGACVLQAVLSDGGQEFVAVEYRDLKGKLSIRTLPGSKVLLSASTPIRRGRVLLTPDSVRVLGSPRFDIWGPKLASMRRADALREAGLPVPAASTFDSIAAEGIVAPMGLADTAITERDIEQTHDEDEFWAAAVAVADAQVVDSTTPTRSIRVSDPSPLSYREQHQQQYGQHNQANNPAADVLIDSDDSAEVAPTDPVTCPLNYLSENCELKAIYRLFATRARMKGTSDCFELKICVEDGNTAGELLMGKKLADLCTGGLTSSQIVEMARSGTPEELKRFKTSVRQNVRAMHGFAFVSQTADSAEVENIFPSLPNSEAFIAQYASNLEKRWALYEEKNQI